MEAGPHPAATRVLWLTKGLGPGGAERLLLSFARCATTAPVELHAAYLLPWKDHLVGPLTDAGVHVHCLDAPRVADPRWLGRLVRLVRRERIDVVHDHSPLVAALARPVLRALPGSAPALVGTEHNEWGSHHRATRLLNRATVGLEAHTFAVSEGVRASMGRAGQRAETLIHGVEVAAIADRRTERARRRAELGLAPDTTVVVTVANLRATKDHETLLRAARRVRDGGHDVVFLCVGQGPLADVLAERRDGLGLGDHVRFLGHQEDPISVLVAADVFCLTSRVEGLPIAVLEALAVGLPVVCTDVGGLDDVVGAAGAGIVVPVGDDAAVARAVVDLVDGDRRRSLASAAAATARRFDVGTAVARQLEVYEQRT